MWYSYKSLRLLSRHMKSLCFNWAPRHEGVLGKWRYSSTHSLASAPDGGEWSASRRGLITPRERAPGTHWIGDWVGPRAVLNAVVKRKIPSPRRESNPRPQSSSPEPSAIPTEFSRLLIMMMITTTFQWHVHVCVSCYSIKTPSKQYITTRTGVIVWLVN
jgi:hypothetical protein